MKTTEVTRDDIARSVLAVPPLARNRDLSLNHAANKAIIEHIEAGGVSSLLYGGNANFYNVGLYEYAALIDSLEQTAANDTWLIPSVGPDLGKMLDQAAILRERKYPTAMVLPLMFPATVEGVEAGVRRFVDAFGRPAIIYLKNEPYLTVEAVRRLVDDGCVSAIKYAIVRQKPELDEYLTRLVDVVDRRIIFSGIGERPAVIHLRNFKLQGFTSGSVCVAPRGSQKILRLLQAGDDASAQKLRAHYIPLEDLRDGHSPIRVLHEAIRLAGIADTGPMLPLLSNVPKSLAQEIAPVATQLLAWDQGLP